MLFVNSTLAGGSAEDVSIFNKDGTRVDSMTIDAVGIGASGNNYTVAVEVIMTRRMLLPPGYKIDKTVNMRVDGMMLIQCLQGLDDALLIL